MYNVCGTMEVFREFYTTNHTTSLVHCIRFYNDRVRTYQNDISAGLETYILTLVLLNPDILCLCKQYRSRSVGFWRSQLIWICTVCHYVCEFVSTTWIKLSDRLKIRSGCGILMYSAWQGLRAIYYTLTYTAFYTRCTKILKYGCQCQVKKYLRTCAKWADP